ncbi:alpha/beta fold hydrolase [Tropicimonas sp. S265A]|uniref:alpha/beta fold hydrolase n=1 Tax=Tropicimonas sp. S265A TaxID=3415134 RepID=UPI003C7B8174
MSDISVLLVHGELHGAWCWRDVAPELREHGLSVRAIDLPGHGADPTPVQDITFESYARAVLAEMGPRTLLVGQGMGGYAVSAAAEAATDRTAGIIYVSAYIPSAHRSVADMRARAARDPFDGITRAADDGQTFAICPDAVHDLLYHDCPPGILTYAGARINREPVAPLRVPLNALERAIRVPRYAIITENDHMISPEYQAEMAEGIPQSNIRRLATSHASFFTDPKGLASEIARIARAV